MRVSPRVQGLLWFIFIMCCLTVMFTAMFFGTAWIYHIVGWTPLALVVQLINSVGGICLFGLIVTAIGRLFSSRRVVGEMRIYGPIIDALERVAKGDFSVQIENIFERQYHSMIGELINSVNRMALELNQMETMRQEFISNVSHEIQSPLTSIRGFAQALQSNHLSVEESTHYLNIIETESTRLSKLSDNLLKLASLEAQQVKFEPKPYRLDRQIRNLILACEPQWSNKALEMDASLQEVTMSADEDLLNQVWINLIHNSIKFTLHGGSICIALSRHGDNVECKITDTGIGIAAQDQAHIFDRFYKVDQARQRSKEGSGLGLSIVKKIVELHHGTITLESTPGVGTTFFVSLPIC